ncbi:MAG: uracil-DNA glycosylase [SAR202 cluster bacterium]|nr:MAG: uracil-DNA glycosylase [SAR202 cluster bacterium]KAA1299489.1 MAG: uracil-DNA glycosylase [SAR202 cluster bacterium]
MSKEIKLPNGWKNKLSGEFEKEYMIAIKSFLLDCYKSGKEIYPKSSEIFNAFNHCDFNEVKVVIIGQDPYHGKGQANGLCFSVNNNIPKPPSLVNIFKELENDLSKKFDSENGNLERWARQGVFLLNTTLTVEKNKPMSHSNIGWDKFTDKVIETLSKDSENLVFILWGNHAQKKIEKINISNHMIIKSVHPSPLSAHRGFFGSKPFTKTNNYLKSKNISEINW